MQGSEHEARKYAEIMVAASDVTSHWLRRDQNPRVERKLVPRKGDDGFKVAEVTIGA